MTFLIPLASCAARDIEPTVDGEVLEFEVTDLDGNAVRHTDERFAGKVVLVDIWGTWCPPCRDAVPGLVELQDEYREKGLVIVGVAFEDSKDATVRRERVTKFAEELGVNYLLCDGGTREVEEVFPTLKGFRGFPTVVIIGRDGKVRHANTVFIPREEKKIRREVEKALETDTGESK
jgi:thiol-disulfide isomerase/thioredoxin